jgi:heme exporter protein C
MEQQITAIKTPRNWHIWASPAKFTRVARVAMPLSFALMGALLVVGLYYALIASPPDYQQGITVRIMYVHVPAAWMALFIYLSMAFASGGFLIWRHPMAAMAAREMAPIGAMFCAVCLLTGMLWGKPMWGAYWVWDARLTSMLLLFFLYLGFMALNQLGQGNEKLSQAASWVSILGVINLPIIKFSVEWWNTLHQPASVLRLSGTSIDASMLTPLLLMGLAASFFSFGMLFWRMQIALREQKLSRMHARAIAGHTREIAPQADKE